MERSAIYLGKVASGKLVEADLFDGISDEHLKAWRTTWIPEVATARKRLLAASVPKQEWPLDLHWNWDAKIAQARAAFLGYQPFSVICERDLQGLMLVNLTKTARLSAQLGKDLVYIEYLATAPWNRKELLCEPRFRGLGRALIRVAIELSLQSELQGRIALHSLPQADGFYQNTCGMTPLGKDKKYQNLVYFEMTPEQAEKFRRVRKAP